MAMTRPSGSCLIAHGERQVDGFIVATGHTDHVAHGRRLLARGVLAVMVNRDAHGVPFPSVAGRRCPGIRASLSSPEHLGHVRLVHLAGPAGFSTSEIREPAPSWTAARTSASTGRIVPRLGLQRRRGPNQRIDEVLDDSGIGPSPQSWRQRLARTRCLSFAPPPWPSLPRGHLCGRVQRHAVRGRLPSPDDDGAFAALRARCRVGARAARLGSIRTACLRSVSASRRADRARLDRPGAALIEPAGRCLTP